MAGQIKTLGASVSAEDVLKKFGGHQQASRLYNINVLYVIEVSQCDPEQLLAGTARSRDRL
jgi:hypothetical protein